MSAAVPYVPDTAPFSPEQRGWLNGFLAGLYSAAPAAAAPATAPLKVCVLHASQSGTGESLARKLSKELKARGFVPTLAPLNAYTPAALAAEEHAVIIASTYGEGDPPDAARPFFEELARDSAPRFDKLRYSVLALGDKHYEHFCKFGSDLDERLHALGAERIVECVECDLEVDQPFSQWKTGVLERLSTLANGNHANGNGSAHALGGTSALALAAPVALAPTVPPATREHPFYAPLIEKRALTHDVSSKLTMHLSLSLAEAENMAYEAGDALGILARNNERLIEEVLDAAQLTGAEPVTLGKAGAAPAMPMLEALTHHLHFTRLNRKIVEAFAQRADCSTLRGLLVPEQQTHLEKFCWDRGLIDLLTAYPGAISDAADLAALLPRLAPRLYSISSSPAAHPGQVHATVAIVRYRSHNRERGGVCSTLLAERTSLGESLPTYIQPNKRFRLPADPTTPIIMVGPGTGIAPFRAFLHQRRGTGATGRNWLFFGERSAQTDFLYREELEAMQSDGHLTRLDLAFSRDQDRKIYVQDRMLEQAAALWSWLEQGASFYICGDAVRMAKDVDTTLQNVIAQQGSLSPDAAAEYLADMKDQQRYQRDTY